MTESTTALTKPSARLSLTETFRAGVEELMSHAALPSLALAPRGDGHRVLVLPGFLADDESTALLRSRIKRQGYRAEAWELGSNIGPTDAILDGLSARLQALAKDGEPVSLIGWSMGGAYACWLARQHPQAVRTVITLASPLQPIDPMLTAVGSVFDGLKPLFSARSNAPEGLVTAGVLTVPHTAIYSRLDGVLPWRACLAKAGRQTENIAIHASHTGMGSHIAALYAIADRLAQPRNRWKPFRPPLPLHWWYPAQEPGHVNPYTDPETDND
jgi:pimeloyl-ACP methyl ester carboxylesterase